MTKSLEALIELMRETADAGEYASPAEIRTLIAALESETAYRKGAFVACNGWHDKCREAEGKLGAAEKRITELEALCVKPRIAPHQYRACVNELTENAREYAGAGQLRERISYVLGEYIEPDHSHTRASPCVKLSNAADELEIVVNWIGGLPVPTAAATLNYGRVLDAIKAIRAAGGTVEGGG